MKSKLLVILSVLIVLLGVTVPSVAQEECTEYREVTDEELVPGADLSCTNLQDSYLYGVNLQGADLSGANLTEANLYGANLLNADLDIADLQSANLNNANLQDADLSEALFDEITILPDGTSWISDTDMERFTDPEHPNFWCGYGLSGDLSRMDFSDANLRGVNFRVGTNLQNVDLSGTNLQDAYLGYSDLQGADFKDANLQDANLTGAKLQNADLRGANLEHARLYGVNIRLVEFDETTTLPDGVSWSADRNMLQFTDALAWIATQENLRGVYLGRANFWNANLDYADLSGADLRGISTWDEAGSASASASFVGADLSEANLQDADLSSSDLQGAYLRDANLQGADLTSAIFDETTVLPDYSNWTPDTDMARFTDPEHPDFWDPCVELDSAPWYCEDEGDE